VKEVVFDTSTFAGVGPDDEDTLIVLQGPGGWHQIYLPVTSADCRTIRYRCDGAVKRTVQLIAAGKPVSSCQHLPGGFGVATWRRGKVCGECATRKVGEWAIFAKEGPGTELDLRRGAQGG